MSRDFATNGTTQTARDNTTHAAKPGRSPVKTGNSAVPAGEFLLSEEVAAILGISRSTVQEWIARGRLPHRKPPGTRRCFIPVADFKAWMDGAELETVKLAAGGRIVRPKQERKGR